MKNLTHLSFISIILIASIILISTVSAVDEANNLESIDNDNEDLEINNIPTTENDALGSDNHGNEEGYIEFEKDNYEIEENKQNTNITGTVYYYESNFDEYDSYWEELNIYCNYTDGNNVSRSYTITSDSNGKFLFNLNQCEGLIAAKSPYTLTFTPVHDSLYTTFIEENSGKGLADSWITLTVTPAQNIPIAKTIYVGQNGQDLETHGSSDNPYKSIAYAVSKANNNDTIYIYEGNYDENPITLNKTLTFIGQNRNVLISSSKTSQGQKLFDDTKTSSSYKFINLTFASIKFGANSQIFNFKNTGINEFVNCTFNQLALKYVIYSTANETKISDCEFNNNSITAATSGSALYLGKTSIVSNTQFNGSLNNLASAYVNLISVAAGTALTTNNITVTGTAGKWNLFYINKNSIINIENSKIINNEMKSQSATGGGMLFYLLTGGNQTINVNNSIIANNTLQNGYFYVFSANVSNFNMNNNVIYNNTGKIIIKSLPIYDLSHNYWGDNNKPEGVNVSNWIIAQTSVSPDEVLNNEEFSVSVELKLNDTNGTISKLKHNIPEVAVTIEYNNQKVNKKLTTSPVTASFTFDNTVKEVTTTILNEKQTTEIPQKEFVIYVRSSDGVDDDGYGTKNKPYKSIKYAVLKADTNYTIYIYEGRYDENSITINKNLTIVGENKANVIITSSINNKKIFEAPYDTNTALKFENLTFDLINPGDSNGILHLRNNIKNEIINCVFENNAGEFNIWSAANETLIENCEFKNIEFSKSGDIIKISGKGKQSIINTTFSKITSIANGVVDIIYIQNRPNIITVDNITISDCSGQLNGIRITNSGYGNVSNAMTVKNSKFENNDFKQTGNRAAGSLFFLTESSKMEITNSTINNNKLVRGIFAGSNNESKFIGNYNLIYNNTGNIIFSVSAAKPVKDYDMNYNYWGSENPDLGDLYVDIIATNENLSEMKTVLHPVDPVMTINIVNSSVFEGENVTIEITLNENATGTITIIGLYNVNPQQLENGKTTFKLSDLLPNDYIISIKYSGDDNYNPKEIEDIEFSIKDKLDSPINVEAVEIYEGETAKLTISLPENATGTISIYLNNQLNNTLTIENNTININFKNLTVGTNNITITYSGDKQFKNNTINTTITVKEQLTPEINVKAVEIYEGETAKLTISLPENATGTISIYLNNQLNNTLTIENNTININFKNLTVGTNNITITYSGDKQFKNNTINTTITVKNKIVVPEIKKYVLISVDENNTVSISINLPEDATGKITIHIDNTNITKELVNGSAMHSEKLDVGKHNIFISYEGNEKYNGFTTKEIITIKNNVSEEILNITAPKDSETQSYSINLPSDAKGNLTVIVDGKDTYTKALENGSATVDITNLNPGNHNITITYTGDENYLGISKSTTVNVAQKTPTKEPEKQPRKTTVKNSKITAKKKSFKAKTKVKKYSITLNDGKNPIRNVKVTLKIKGKTYTAKTNAKGQATFKLKMLTKKGKYTAAISFKGNNAYKTSSKKVKIIVN